MTRMHLTGEKVYTIALRWDSSEPDFINGGVVGGFVTRAAYPLLVEGVSVTTRAAYQLLVEGTRRIIVLITLLEGSHRAFMSSRAVMI